MGEANSYHRVIHRAGAKLAYSRYAGLLSGILVLAYADKERPKQFVVQKALPSPSSKTCLLPVPYVVGL